MSFFGLKSTKQHSDYWKNRKIDWEQAYLSTWNHPHRQLITQVLKHLDWMSLFEIGCGPGANLAQIVKTLPNRPYQLGGVDINPEAIALAQKTFQGGVFHTGDGSDVLMSDKSTDVVLTDMMLIYVDPLNIGRYIKELKRIARKYVLLCEFHSDSWWQRLKIRLTSGYHTYDYKRLLEEYDFYDISIIPIPQNAWPDDTGVRHIIVAKVPLR